jgi:hypothetical protein
MWDDAIEVTVGVNPGQQLVRHLVDMYHEYTSRFLVAPPLYVQVLMLSLVDPGTTNARVLLKQSVKFPLYLVAVVTDSTRRTNATARNRMLTSSPMNGLSIKDNDKFIGGPCRIVSP